MALSPPCTEFQTPIFLFSEIVLAWNVESLLILGQVLIDKFSHLLPLGQAHGIQLPFWELLAQNQLSGTVRLCGGVIQQPTLI